MVIIKCILSPLVSDTVLLLCVQVEGTAVGFMSVNSEVDVDLLNSCFELGAFHGLKAPHPDDETEPPRTPTPPQQGWWG